MNIPGARTFMRKHSVAVGGHKTSISVEPEFWTEFNRIAKRDRLTLSQLACVIDETRGEDQNLSSAIRVYILQDAIARARENVRRAKLSRLQVRKTKTYTGELRSAIRALTGGDRQTDTRDGLAPTSFVIAARGRANV